MLKRLNLSDNWPLWGAATLFLLMLLYCLFYILSPDHYPFHRVIAYPFVWIYQVSTIFLLCLFIFSLLFFVIAVLWALSALKEGLIFKVIFTPVLMAVVVWTRSVGGEVYLLILLGALTVTIVLSFQQSPKRSVALILAAVALIGSFPLALTKMFADNYHRDRIVFNNEVYQVVQVEYRFKCENQYFVVYQCDGLGIICHPRFTSENYGSCVSGHVNPPYWVRMRALVNFKVDAATDQLYLQIGSERFSERFLISP